MLRSVKKRVCIANKNLVKNGLVTLTWGNASERDQKSGLIVIKPSGIDYKRIKPNDMVVVNLEGSIIEGNLKPSSDLPTHLEIYKEHPTIGGIVHTHSTYATSFAQVGKSIKTYGTTHADYFNADIPCTRTLTRGEISHDYEKNTGKVINELFKENDLSATSACLVYKHGVFSWGKNCNEALEHALVLEEVAKMAYLSETICNNINSLETELHYKHSERKHGVKSYYGQKNKR